MNSHHLPPFWVPKLHPYFSKPPGSAGHRTEPEPRIGQVSAALELHGRGGDDRTGLGGWFLGGL